MHISSESLAWFIFRTTALVEQSPQCVKISIPVLQYYCTFWNWPNYSFVSLMRKKNPERFLDEIRWITGTHGFPPLWFVQDWILKLSSCSDQIICCVLNETWVVSKPPAPRISSSLWCHLLCPWISAWSLLNRSPALYSSSSFFFFFKILSERLFVSVWRRRCCTKFCDLIRHHHCRCWDTGGVLTVYGSCAPLSEGHRAGVEAQLVCSVSVSAGLCVTVIRNLPCSWLDLERLRCERGLLP